MSSAVVTRAQMSFLFPRHSEGKREEIDGGEIVEENEDFRVRMGYSIQGDFADHYVTT